MKKIISSFFILCSFSLNSAQAATISESSFSGGFDFFTTFTRTFGLDSGENSVSGTLAGTCVSPGNCDTGDPGTGNTQDTFNIEISSGFKLDSIFVTTSNVTGPANFSASFSLRDAVFSPTPTMVSEPFLPLNTTTINLATSTISPGIYSISMFGQQASFPGNGDYFLDYSINFGVSAVPIPAAAWLFGSGLLGLISVARRKKS